MEPLAETQIEREQKGARDQPLGDAHVDAEGAGQHAEYETGRDDRDVDKGDVL